MIRPHQSGALRPFLLVITPSTVRDEGGGRAPTPEAAPVAFTTSTGAVRGGEQRHGQQEEANWSRSDAVAIAAVAP